jgi:hypothetical protein
MGSDTDRLKTGRRQSGSHIPRGLKQRIRKKFSQECLRLLTCLLMGDPKHNPNPEYFENYGRYIKLFNAIFMKQN